jgi:hypothetical protein
MARPLIAEPKARRRRPPLHAGGRTEITVEQAQILADVFRALADPTRVR